MQVVDPAPRRPTKHPTTYEQTRYEPPATYDPVPPPVQPTQLYYSSRHAQAQPSHHPPAQYIGQAHPYIAPQQHAVFSHAPQMMSAFPSSQEWDQSSRQPRMRGDRPRANTIGNLDTIPLQLRQAATRIDPSHQIRPSPAYYPPSDIEGIITDDGMENSTSRNLYAVHGGGYQGGGGGSEGGIRPRKKSQGNREHNSGAGGFPGQGQTGRQQQPQGQGQMLVPPQQNLFRGSARALEDGLMPPWQ
jgi:hypothetical protein